MSNFSNAIREAQRTPHPADPRPTRRDAYARYAAAAREAVKFHDPNWTNSAITRERYKRLQDARAELRRATEATTAGNPTNAEQVRAEALEQLAATDSNSVAVARNEWGKVQALLNSGRSLEQIIGNADRRRLSAILDHLDSDLATQSDDPEGVAAEVSQAVLVRLGALGDEKAQEALTAQSAGEQEIAWQAVIEEVATGPVSIRARTALYRANPDDYRAAFDDDDMEAAEVEQAIANLDRLGANLREEAPHG